MFMFDTATIIHPTMDEDTPTAAPRCIVYVKHGDNPTQAQTDIARAPSNTWAEFVHQWLNYYVFPSDFTVSVEEDTWLWTSCQDPMMVDFFRLYAPDGSISFGAEDNKGTCISTDADALEDLDQNNEWSEHWHVDLCYETIRLDYGHQDVIMGWAGGNVNSPFWFMPLDLEEEMSLIPSVIEVRACEQDETRTDAECADLVNQILTFQIAQEEMWEPVNSHGDMCNGDALAYCNSYGHLMDYYCDGEVCTTEGQRNGCSRHYRLWGRQGISRKGNPPTCDNQCSRNQYRSCSGFPCVDLRKGDEDHHVMSYVSHGVASVAYFDSEFAADGRTWTCTSKTAEEGSLVGDWSCPGLTHSTMVTITADYANDFTEDFTDDAVDFCQEEIKGTEDGMCGWDALAYCNSYSDLMATYCDGVPCTNNQQRRGCRYHYNHIGQMQIGRGERSLPSCPSYNRRVLNTEEVSTGVTQSLRRLLNKLV